MSQRNAKGTFGDHRLRRVEGRWAVHPVDQIEGPGVYAKLYVGWSVPYLAALAPNLRLQAGPLKHADAWGSDGCAQAQFSGRLNRALTSSALIASSA